MEMEAPSPVIDLLCQLNLQVVGDEDKDCEWTKGSGGSSASSAAAATDEGYGVCAICLERILMKEIALIKGCEHAYCVTCILRWATFKQNPSCPQCKHPFEFLNVHRSLDGWYCPSLSSFFSENVISAPLSCVENAHLLFLSSCSIHDYMFEESVCLLLRATWFVPLIVEAQEDVPEEPEEFLQHYYDYGPDEDDLDEEAFYFNSNSSNIRIGNRRWGDNGYVRGGRKEARPVNRQAFDDPGAGPSRCSKKTETTPPKDVTGRRAKRALKREAADKAAAEKHQQHLQRFGRK